MNLKPFQPKANHCWGERVVLFFNINNLFNAQKSGSIQANFDLKLGSFNIQGQANRNQVKLRKVKQLYEKGQYDIFLLQETRSEGSEKEIKNGEKYLTLTMYI